MKANVGFTIVLMVFAWFAGQCCSGEVKQIHAYIDSCHAANKGEPVRVPYFSFVQNGVRKDWCYTERGALPQLMSNWGLSPLDNVIIVYDGCTADQCSMIHKQFHDMGIKAEGVVKWMECEKVLEERILVLARRNVDLWLYGESRCVMLTRGRRNAIWSLDSDVTDVLRMLDLKRGDMISLGFVDYLEFLKEDRLSAFSEGIAVLTNSLEKVGIDSDVFGACMWSGEYDLRLEDIFDFNGKSLDRRSAVIDHAVCTPGFLRFRLTVFNKLEDYLCLEAESVHGLHGIEVKLLKAAGYANIPIEQIAINGIRDNRPFCIMIPRNEGINVDLEFRVDEFLMPGDRLLLSVNCGFGGKQPVNRSLVVEEPCSCVVRRYNVPAARIAAIQLAGERGYAEALPVLRKALSSPRRDAVLDIVAIGSIGLLGDSSDISRLSHFMKCDSRRASAAQAAIRRINERSGVK